MARRSDDDFRREIEAHIAIETDRLIAEGASPADARRAAVQRFGNVASTQERFYESRRVMWLEELRQDVRYAFSALRRSPGFAAVALLTLALGIGANTAIFSVINAVVLRPLPYRDPGSLVLVQPGEIGLSPSWVVTAWRARADTLADLAGFEGPRASTLIAGGEPAEIDSASITWNFLSFLGVAPALGRAPVAADGAPGAPPVALLSHDLWTTRFGGDAGVIGRTIAVSGISMTVIGVTDPAFRFPTAGALPAFGLPIDMQPDVMRVFSQTVGTRPRNMNMNVLARLAPGSTSAAASAQLLAIYKQEGLKEFPASMLERSEVRVEPLRERLAGDVPERLRLVMGAVAFVLLIACANVANLLLARASTRQRELALRAALGARTWRLVRLILTESMLLALLGSLGALVFAYSMRGVVRALLADRIPHVASIAIDWPVLAFTVGIATATGVLCGLASLSSVTRVDPVAALSGSSTYSATGRSLMRRTLLSIEVAITFVLLVGAALLAQTLWNLSARDRGFDADRLLTVRVAPGVPRDLNPADRRAPAKYFATFFTDLVGRLARVQGVTSAGAVSMAPLTGFSAGMGGMMLDGRLAPGESFTPVSYVTPGYFSTMRIPVVAGRDFDERDRLGAGLVAIVNEAFQRRYAPGRDLVGARLTTESGPEEFTIVGMTRDVPDRSLREGPEPLLVAPLAQMPAIHISWGALTFVLRTEEDDPLRLAPDVRRAIWAIDPNIVVSEIATMDQRVAVGMRAERDSALLFGLFALAALVMAAIGVYGVAAYAIAQRTREIGVRMALGAARGDIRRLVVSQTLRPTLLGIAAGVAAALMLTRFVAAMVYGVTPLDAATFASSIVVIVAVALAATWIPARRAMRIDPLAALRYE